MNMKKRMTVVLLALMLLIGTVTCAGCGGRGKPGVSLGSLLPGQPWNSMTWLRSTSLIRPYASGQYNPENMYALLENLPLYEAGEEPGEEEKKEGYMLLVCNPEAEPLTRYTVWIGVSGGVAIENDREGENTQPQYYQTDSEIIDQLDEMLLGYSLRSVMDIGKVKTLADLLPEQPWSLADWLRHIERAAVVVGQGKIDPEKLLELAEKTKLEPQDTGLDPEKKSLVLIISNPDAVPARRCDIYVDELGNVEFDLRVAQGYLVVQYYKADPSLYEALVEILCPEEG